MAHVPRFYTEAVLSVGANVPLPAGAARHAISVLRLQSGASIELFNGDGHAYAAALSVAGRTASATVENRQAGPPCGQPISLALGVSRGDRMDYALQKCVELGAGHIQPLLTARTSVKLSSERLPKKRQHWRNVVISACEQSGRCDLPAIDAPCTLDVFLQNTAPGLVLDPRCETLISQAPLADAQSPIVMIGPESGFSDAELDAALAHGWRGVSLGPLVLRTETAAVVAVAMMRARQALL
ncbi:MAG: 16S rRNA (uracil(1498)-N(3))-methyltransferase [Pseudomonadota bacterium]